MKCWHCGAELDLSSTQKISFRELCNACSAWLHCCRNCKNYQPGLSNDCKIPGTDFVADREAMNFCEEFELLGKGPDQKRNLKSRFNSLFED